MSRDFPAIVDPWAMVRGRRGFTGSWPLARMRRLAELLVRTTGEARFSLAFDTDETGMPYVEVTVAATVWLRCQRTLEPFAYEVDHRSRLGLLASEQDEPALPAGFEPLVVTDDQVRPADLVEDELILALPLVPRSGDGPRDYVSGTPDEPAVAEEQDGPFAALKALKDASTH